MRDFRNWWFSFLLKRSISVYALLLNACPSCLESVAFYSCGFLMAASALLLWTKAEVESIAGPIRPVYKPRVLPDDGQKALIGPEVLLFDIFDLMLYVSKFIPLLTAASFFNTTVCYCSVALVSRSTHITGSASE